MTVFIFWLIFIRTVLRILSPRPTFGRWRFFLLFRQLQEQLQQLLSIRITTIGLRILPVKVLVLIAGPFVVVVTNCFKKTILNHVGSPSPRPRFRPLFRMTMRMPMRQHARHKSRFKYWSEAIANRILGLATQRSIEGLFEDILPVLSPFLLLGNRKVMVGVKEITTRRRLLILTIHTKIVRNSREPHTQMASDLEPGNLGLQVHFPTPLLLSLSLLWIRCLRESSWTLNRPLR